MKKSVLTTVLAAFTALFIFAGCEQQGILSFDEESFAAVNFATDSLSYSFLGNPEDSYLLEVPVQIMGDSSSASRSFKVEVVQDSLTTAEPSDYEILDAVVEAGSFTGTLGVRVFNSPKLDDSQVSLHLRITDSQDFRAGNEKTVDMVLYWTNKVIVPAWTFYRYFFCRYPSTAAYRAIVISTGVTEFGIRDYLEVGPTGATALGKKFAEYVDTYNAEHPGNPLTHDDGPIAGQPVETIY